METIPFRLLTKPRSSCVQTIRVLMTDRTRWVSVQNSCVPVTAAQTCKVVFFVSFGSIRYSDTCKLYRCQGDRGVPLVCRVPLAGTSSGQWQAVGLGLGSMQ